MRIGVRLPQYGATWAELRDTAIRCEALGFDGLWVNDHFQSPGRQKRDDTFEAFTTLAGVAQHTLRARLGVVVASASYRSPALLAKSASVVDAMAPGRMVLGLGTGSDRAEHDAYGIAFEAGAARSQRLRHTLGTIRALFDQPDGATVHGALSDAPNRPAANPPVWVAAHKPGLLELAGRRADGVVAAFLSPEAFATRRAIAESARREFGRPPLAYCLYTFALPITAETPVWLARQAEALGTTPAAIVRWLSSTGLVAPADELRARLDEYAAVGVTDAVLAFPERMPPEAWDALAQATLGTKAR